jgi:hypothetical protein
MDIIEGPTLLCGQQNARDSFEEAHNRIWTQNNETQTPSPYILSNNSPLEKYAVGY